MNRNIVQDLLNNSTTNQSNNHNKSKRKPLLNQTLPKYRSGFFNKTFEQNQNELKSSKIKEKYRNFGQDDFIQKLKLNSTKQIDKKSAKAIQKYLNQINEQNLVKENSLKRTHSLQCINFIFPEISKSNQEIVQPQSSKNNNRQIRNSSNYAEEEQPQLYSSQERIKEMQKMKATKSAKIIKMKSKQLSEQPSSNQNSSQLYRSNHNNQPVTSSKQNSKQNLNLYINKNPSTNKPSPNQYFQSISFRNPSIKNMQPNIESSEQILFLNNDIRPSFQKDYECLNSFQINQHQNLNNFNSVQFQKSDNHFYFKNPSSQSSQTIKFDNKQRPTIDTQQKISYESCEKINFNNKQNSTNNSHKSQQLFFRKQLEKQLLELKQQNFEQSQIIKLQQIMIDKLNSQLEIALNKLQYLSLSQAESNKTNSNSPFIKNVYNQKLQLFEQYQTNIQQNLKNQSQKWSYNYNKLKEVLLSMKSVCQFQSVNDLEFSSNNNQQQEVQQTHQILRFKTLPINHQSPFLQSINEFYHKQKIINQVVEAEIQNLNNQKKDRKKFNYFQELKRNSKSQKQIEQLQFLGPQTRNNRYEDQDILRNNSSFRDIQAAFMENQLK